MLVSSISDHLKRSLNRTLTVDLGPRGITVNAIAPGATKTDMYDKNAELYRNPDSKLSVDEQMKKFSPLGRVGTPSDIAKFNFGFVTFALLFFAYHCYPFQLL